MLELYAVIAKEPDGTPYIVGLKLPGRPEFPVVSSKKRIVEGLFPLIADEVKVSGAARVVKFQEVKE